MTDHQHPPSLNPTSPEYVQGRNAALNDYQATRCPYDVGTQLYNDWQDGYHARLAELAAEEKTE